MTQSLAVPVGAVVVGVLAVAAAMSAGMGRLRAAIAFVGLVVMAMLAGFLI